MIGEFLWYKVEIPVQSYDAYPPGEVTDLAVMLVNDTATNITIGLQWTAPGDELDAGTGKFSPLTSRNRIFKV